MQALLPLLQAKSNDRLLNSCLDDVRKTHEHYRTHAADQGERDEIKPEYVAATIDRLAADDAIFTCDTGMSAVWAARYIRSTGKRTLMGSFSHGSMANAMPQSIGAALHSPNRQVIAFCGDGGLSMLMGDLATIGQYKLPVKLIVFNNRALGMVELEMQVAGLPDWQTKMVNPDFAKVAEACGIRGFSVRDPAQVEPAVSEALEHDEAFRIASSGRPGPVLLDVFTNAFVPTLPPHTSIGVLSRYIESQAKLTLSGRIGEVWESFKTNIHYLRDLT